MRPIELPEFYMPWSAGTNSQLEAARDHAHAWAGAMGMLDAATGRPGSAIWTEDTLADLDPALLAAHTHPETAPAELELLTAWYVWKFFFADHFAHTYRRSEDLAGAREYLARLAVFMQAGPGGIPASANPVERGLADLWTRTVAGRSVDWRLRFADSTRNLFEESFWELANIRENRLADPIEYIEMRRSVGAARWSSDLVEHAVFVEIPPEIAKTRSMRVLKDAFVDGTRLRDDLFAYQREIGDDGQINNGVVVVERFLGCGPRRAADLVNDLITARMHQFEHTTLVELPPLFEEYRLSPTERLNVLGYIKGLQDWQAGRYEWHLRGSGNPGTRPAKTRRLLLDTGSPC